MREITDQRMSVIARRQSCEQCTLKAHAVKGQMKRSDATCYASSPTVLPSPVTNHIKGNTVVSGTMEAGLVSPRKL